VTRIEGEFLGGLCVRTIFNAQAAEICLKSPKSLLDTVSTTCDSGWVDDQHAILLNHFECRGLTHPLSQVVLTVSRLGFRTFEAKPMWRYSILTGW